MKSLSVTIQMKAAEQYLPVVISVYYAVHYYAVLTNFWVCATCSATIQIRQAIEQYIPLVLYKKIVTVLNTFIG